MSSYSQVQILVFTILMMQFLNLSMKMIQLNYINQLEHSLSEMAQILPTLQVILALGAWVADSSSGMNHLLKPLLLIRPSNSRPVMSSTTLMEFQHNQASLPNGLTTPFLIAQSLTTNLSTLSTPQLSLLLSTLETSGPTAAFNSGEIRNSSSRGLLKTTPLTISTTRLASVLLPQLLMLSTQRATVLLGLFRPTTCGTLTPIFRTTPSPVTIMKTKRLNTTMFMLPCGSLLTGISIMALSTSIAHRTSGQYHGQTSLTQHPLSKTTGNMVSSDQTTDPTT